MQDERARETPDCAIAVMAKASISGRTKTRLIPPLTPVQAADLNTAFLRDVADNLLAAATLANISAWMAYAPAGSRDFFTGNLPAGIGLIETAEPSFGACLFRAASSLLAAGREAVCLLNSDSPTLPTGYLVAADRARNGLAPWTTLAWSAAAGIPLLLAIAFALGDPVWPRIWWPLIAMTLGSQIVGQGLILYAVSRVSALIVGLMLLLQPVVAATIGWIVYGERLTPFDFVGALAIAAALLLVRDAERPLPADEMSLSS